MTNQKLSTNVRNAKCQGLIALACAKYILITHSCSLNCYKQHQSSCSSAPALAIADSNEDLSRPTESSPNSSAKVDKEELETLFEHYPELRSELQKIYQASQRDGPDLRDNARNQAGGRAGKANSGFELGLKSLRDVLARDDATSRGLEAFMKLITDRETPKG